MWPYRIDEDATIQKLYNGMWLTLNPYIHGHRAMVKMRTTCNRKVDVPVVWLMADAFMGGKRDGCSIIHKNGAKLDNRLVNLAFATKSETGMLSASNRRRAVEKIDIEGNVIELYASGREAARKNHLCQDSVSARCLGRIKNPFYLTGYSFIFEEGK